MPDWTEIGAAAAGDAGAGAPDGRPPDPGLLGDFLPRLARACDTGDRLDPRALAGFRALGARAADSTVALPTLIDLYLSAAWRAWRRLPAVTGYLAAANRVSLVLVLVAATAGAVAGALALYGLGRWLGEERLRRWLDRIPLVDPADLDKADRWFERHGRRAVLFGRCAPVVRSLVSVPAGADRMPLGRFVVLTALGSGVWNALFVGVGYLLGERWRDVEKYSHWFDYAVGAFFVSTVAWWVINKRRRAATVRGDRPS